MNISYFIKYQKKITKLESLFPLCVLQKLSQYINKMQIFGFKKSAPSLTDCLADVLAWVEYALTEPRIVQLVH